MMLPFTGVLGTATECQLRRLCEVLWSWPSCENCNNHKACADRTCSSKRFERLSRYFQFYRGLTQAYDPESDQTARPALGNHESLFELIRRLHSNPNIAREDMSSLFANSLSPSTELTEDQDYAINLAVRVMAMINCSAQNQAADLLEYGLSQKRWYSSMTLAQFIEDAFPKTDYPDLNDLDTSTSQTTKSAIVAKRLKKVAGISFRPTDDLRSHLKLNRRTNELEIFHHTAFLKEHLRLSKDLHSSSSVEDCLKLGALPRGLVLEVLDSIQQIIFPLSDDRSRSILASLVSTAGFDPDCIRLETAWFRRPEETNTTYLYFGARLAELYEEVKNPTPHGWMEIWLDRKSAPRYVMLATLLGVLIAVLLGGAALAVSIYQAYIGYQAWQHPVKGG